MPRRRAAGFGVALLAANLVALGLASGLATVVPVRDRAWEALRLICGIG